MVIRLGHLYCDHCNEKIWPPEMIPLTPYYSCPNCGDILCNEAIKLFTQEKSRIFKCRACDEPVSIQTWPRPCE